MPYKLLIPILVILLCVSGTVSAQLLSDAASEKADVRAARLLNRLDNYAYPLYTGAEYIRTYPNVSGHPFLVQDSLQAGSIAYQGIFFPDARINFDIVRSEVVVAGPKAYWLRLVPEHIDSFSMGTRRFRYYSGQEVFHPKEGYYEVLHDGKVLVLAAHVKRIVSAFREGEASRFEQLASYYMVQGRSMQRIRSQAELVNAFGNNKSNIKKELQRLNLSFRRNPVVALTTAAGWYEQANK